MENVVKSVRDLILEFPGLIKTITSDNGSEFMNAKAIEEMGIEYFMPIVIVHMNEEQTKTIIN